MMRLPIPRHLETLARHIGWYLAAVAITAVATAVCLLVQQGKPIPNISLLYLPAILLIAVYAGAGPSLATAGLSVLAYDYFLVQPLHSFTITNDSDVLAFVIFVITAILTSQLAARGRTQLEAGRRRLVESVVLHELGQALMGSHELPILLRAVTEQVVKVLDVDRCSIFVPGSDRLELAAVFPPQSRPDRVEAATARWVLVHDTEVDLPHERSGRRTYVPLKTIDGVLGVMEVGLKRSGESLDAPERRLVTSFAAQAALVMSRAQAEAERQRLSVVQESDRLKSALLSAVSHDLRTPLASIKAAATALLLPDAHWSQQEGQDMLYLIDQEADRLNRLVGNLLDLSRIEAGVLRPVLEWYDVHEAIDLFLPRVRPLLGERSLDLSIDEGLPPVHIDLLRIEELLLNLFENAVRYTPPGSPLELRLERGDDGLLISVVDHGPGVPVEQRSRIFDRFYRGRQLGDRERGTGLGLAICRGIAEAHGGTLEVMDTPGGGATFQLHLPSSCLQQVAS